jgi:AcrR family transcriptional regulator
MTLVKKANAHHHGALREALLAEAERVIDTQGLEALSLRSISRAVGVTHAAPSNHFGDLTGLLSELAADGLRRLAQRLQAAIRVAGPGLRDRAHAMARAYLHFAIEHPGMLVLMSRSAHLDPARPALREAMEQASRVLDDFADEIQKAKGVDPVRAAAERTALRALIHGYSALLVDGRLDRTLAALPEGTTPESFFDVVLDVIDFP